MHLQTNRMNASGQDKTYVAEKLRGAAVMYGPAVVLFLFEGISVLLTALGRKAAGLPASCVRSWP